MSDTAPVQTDLLPQGKLLYQCDFPIRWGDMDALGHVNNTVYFRYFEQTRLQWLEQCGFALGAENSQGVVIVDNHAEYIKPVIYPAHVCIRMGGHSPGRSSFISTYTLSVGDRLFTRGSSKVVWINIKAGKAMRMPDWTRELLEPETDSYE